MRYSQASQEEILLTETPVKETQSLVDLVTQSQLVETPILHGPGRREPPLCDLD